MSKMLEDLLKLTSDESLLVLISDWIPKKGTAHLQSLKRKRKGKTKMSNQSSSNSTANAVHSPKSKNDTS
ncbi:hypothetical protein C2S52_001773 [Perilla frutescens var. hirtella]|nr:hypothetical protein C2S51_006790 [Perilla frutescens var. frutescens]KAH6801309.1 hypothetical protein C2S52_001773 [Perilla frutescens var. hirtella]